MSLKYCGVVTDKSWYESGGEVQQKDIGSNLASNRIYTDEVEMADGEFILNIKLEQLWEDGKTIKQIYPWHKRIFMKHRIGIFN